MNIKIFCMNCDVEILQADTDTLKTPLVGSMFRVKHLMEWDLFSAHDVGNDLVCPQCTWTFHEEGKLKVAVNGDYVVGKPEVIIPGIVACSDDDQSPAEREKKEVVKNDINEEKPLSRAEAEEVVAEMKQETAFFNKIIEESTEKEPDPTLKNLTEQVEGKKPEPKPEQPQLNDGAWNKTNDTDEDSELMAKAPPGTEATELVTKRQPKRVVKKRRAKKAMRKGVKRGR